MKTSSTVAYRENRARFPLDELRKFDGNWVAFSADGRRVVASGSSIAKLTSLVRAANEDMRDVVLEHIELDSDEISLGGAELL